MKRKAVGFIFALLVLAVFLYGCGGGGGSHSNPAAPNNTGLARVSGKIVDSAQKPVADVKVRLALTTNSLVNSLPNEIKNTLRLSTTDNSTEFNTTTDKDGQYTFENVPYGRYSLFANSGDKGALITNLEVSESIRAVKKPTIMKPFGFVTGTVKDGENKAIYGARVYISDDVGNPITAVNGTKNGLTSFTNNEGAFTLSYIPIETQYSFTASLEGYGPKTDSFTISAKEDKFTHNCEDPIILEPSTSESYKVPVTVEKPKSSDGSTSDSTVYVIAKDLTTESNIFYNVFSLTDTETCTISITKKGTYQLFAISSDGAYRWSWSNNPLTVEGSNIPGERSETINLTLPSSTTEPKTVLIKKIEINPIFDESPITYQSDTLNKYGDCVSCLDSFGSLFYTTLDEIDRKKEWNEVSLNSGGIICGSSAVCFSSSDGFSIWYTKDGDKSFITIPLDENVVGINKLAFYPNDYISVAYDYNCADIHYYYVDTYEPLEEGVVSDVPFKKQKRDYSYRTSSGETIMPFALRMAKGSDGNCYLAALYSDHGLRIYNVSTSNESDYVAFENNNVGNDFWDMTNFQVLNDSNGNILFYIENERSDNKVYAYLINKSAKTNVSDSNSTRKSCYIDQKGNMYRYDSSEATTTNTTGHKIIKISSSSPTLDGTATTTMDLAESSAPNEEINGILGFEETPDQVTIFVY